MGADPTTRKKPRQTPKVGVGMPGMLRLEQYGLVLHDAFREMPFLVGSASRGKEWRDVDVRVMLPDSRFRRIFGKGYRNPHTRWSAVCWAFAALGKEMTGLPIDFQVQPVGQANAQYAGHVRIPIGLGYVVGIR